LWGNVRERAHWGNTGVDVSIILRWIFMKWDVGVWNASSWLRIGQVVGICERGNESSSGIKFRDFFD
jgi:hypothetical protein